jgi:[ribosomal protein S5]-alanine N-acetyltransferase
VPVPTLRTARLTLRPFTAADAPALEVLVGAYEVALNTMSIPHPYPAGAAAVWIGGHEDDFRNERIHHFAIDDGEVAGAIGLIMKGEGLAELGYWLGVPFWNRGYMTEAAAEVLRYGFVERGLRRIFACCFARNAGSARVMEKIGMRHEGTLRAHAMKWGEPQDVMFYGILREEWPAPNARETEEETAGRGEERSSARDDSPSFP